MRKNNILITGGLSKLGVEFINQNFENNNFFIIYNSKEKLKKFNLHKNKNIFFIKINFKIKNNNILKILKNIPKINILIFMSGYNPGRKKIYNFTKKNILDSFYINFYYHFLILQTIYKKMAKLKNCQIINISSNSALTGGKMIYPYASMKSALSNILDALKEDQKYKVNKIKIVNYYLKNIKNYKIAAKKIILSKTK